MSGARVVSKKYWALALILLSSFMAVLPAVEAFADRAYTGTVFGRTAYHGYFDNGVQTTNDENLLDSPIPSSVNSPTELVNFLRGLYNSGGKNRASSAVIVQTLLGKNGAPGLRTVTTADWDNLQWRLEAHASWGGINWFETRPSCEVINSWYMPLENDVAWRIREAEAGRICSDSTIVFRDPGGSIAYELNRRCGNPMGRSRALQNPSGSMTPVVESLVNGTADTTAEEGQPITFRFRVNNNSTLVTTRTSYPQARVYKENPDGSTTTLATYSGGGTPANPQLSVLPSNRTYIHDPTRGGNASHIYNALASLATHGARVCATLTINPRNAAEGSPVATTSAPVCITLGKRPKMYVAGGDIIAGGTFRNSSGVCPVLSPAPSGVRGGQVFTQGATTYSSYADYGVMSLGAISLFGANGSPPSQPLADSLSYGNSTNMGYFYSSGRGTPATGNPTQARCLNDPFAIFAPRVSATTTATTIDVATVGSSVRYTGPGRLLITASSPIAPGRKIIVDAPNASSVDIISNIQYADGPYASVNDLPQIVILSGSRILVQNVVSRIDGIYAAKTDFWTCHVAPLLNQCGLALTVNGAVIAGNRVVPLRSAGAQAPNYGDKAETFRLRPDVLLNQLSSPNSNTVIRTIEQREVPARF